MRGEQGDGLHCWKPAYRRQFLARAVGCGRGAPALPWRLRLAGIGIANRIIETHGASPWRMGAGDYEEAIAQSGTAIDDLPMLDGRPLEAVWDPELSPLMVEIGRVVHEEALLGLLIADLMR